MVFSYPVQTCPGEPRIQGALRAAGQPAEVDTLIATSVSDAGPAKSASRRVKFPGPVRILYCPPPAYPKHHGPRSSSSSLRHQDSGMVAPAAFRGGGGERGDSLGGESLCEGDTRGGPR